MPGEPHGDCRALFFDECEDCTGTFPVSAHMIKKTIRTKEDTRNMLL